MCESEGVYSVVVSTWCASLMCETSAMTMEPSAPKGEMECKCLCVSVCMYVYVHECVCVTQQFVCVRACVCISSWPSVFFCARGNFHEVSETPGFFSTTR